MKKLVLATLLASSSTLAMAGAFDDLYVQGDVGLSKLEVKVEGEKFKDNNTGYSIALGKDMGTFRYQADYTDFGKITENYSDGNLLVDIGSDEGTATLKAQSLGFSAIYDFKPVFSVTPYAGLRVGVNQLKGEDNIRSSTFDTNGQPIIIPDYESYKKTKVGVGVLAGVQYAFNPKLLLDAGVEYNHLGKLEDYKFNQYGVKVGLRYNF